MDDKKYIIPNLYRAMNLIEILSDYPEGWSISQLAEEMDIPTNSVFRILKTLVDKGYVVQRQKSYLLTSKLYHVGAKIYEESSLLERVLPHMRALRDETKETVVVGVLHDAMGVVLEQTPGLFPVKVVVEIGYQFPLYCTAPGKSFLAHLPIHERKELLADCSYEAKTKHTITSYDAMAIELSGISRLGYSIDLEESDYHVNCVSSPILNMQRRPIAALWITAPKNRLTKSRCKTVGELLKRHTDEISAEMGFSPLS